jgi:hypothetical protein
MQDISLPKIKPPENQSPSVRLKPKNIAGKQQELVSLIESWVVDLYPAPLPYLVENLALGNQHLHFN